MYNQRTIEDSCLLLTVWLSIIKLYYLLEDHCDSVKDKQFQYDSGLKLHNANMLISRACPGAFP